uniref:Uncharacterized protein n=1 Tax=Anopheles culicifacies TaxID=139723 RepID=A0A182MGQ8_9DIPT
MVYKLEDILKSLLLFELSRIPTGLESSRLQTRISFDPHDTVRWMMGACKHRCTAVMFGQQVASIMTNCATVELWPGPEVTIVVVDAAVSNSGAGVGRGSQVGRS